ncbi:hypothetical protein [Cystobacter fuscus]|uniref:hypothetical protein n=1 Tax=Cystobacter fuscus TaxID=43 RepID=UPI0037BFD910
MKARVLSALFPVLLSLPALAAEPVRADLDGDGKPESITVKWDVDQGGFTLQVGSASVRAKTEDPNEGGVEVVDLDRGDKWKDIAITTGQTDSDHRVFLYGFDGKTLKPLGEVHALTEAKGNGIILSDSWMGFWNKREKYVLDRPAWKIRAVPQPLYAVGVECKVKQSFPIVQGRSDKTPVATLAQDSRIQVLAADTSGRPGEEFYLVKSSTGLLGWASRADLEGKTEGLPFAG